MDTREPQDFSLADGDDLSSRERRFWRSMEREPAGDPEAAFLRQLEKLVHHLDRKALRCGARTKHGDHHPCWNLPVPGRTRCKWHGGMSTGPKSDEGRQRIAEAQRRRWAKSLREPARGFDTRK